MFERAKTGEVQGAIGINSVDGGADEIEICGIFADDFERATRVALAGFNSMLGYQACAVPSRQSRELPRGLRKEHQDEIAAAAARRR